MTIKATLWDKISPVTLSGKEFAPDFLLNHWNGESRVLISYDGIISRVQHVTDADFSPEEKAYMQTLIADGLSRDEAIANVWEFKASNEANTTEVF